MELIRKLVRLLARSEEILYVELCPLKGFPPWVKQEVVLVRVRKR